MKTSSGHPAPTLMTEAASTISMFELGETIEYLQIEDVNTRIMKTYKPSVVTVNGKTVEDNIIVMTDKATDVTISKTDITGTEEIGGASLAVYRAEDILDGEPIEG